MGECAQKNRNDNMNWEECIYKFQKTLVILIAGVSSMISLSSCEKTKSPDEEERKSKMTLLVYAVVSDLNLESDKAEMIKGASNLDLDENHLLVYQVYKTGNPQLLELVRNQDGQPEFRTAKTFDREQYSTDPKRISTVIDEVLTQWKAQEYGMIFWSHGTGWTPSFSNHGETRSDDNTISFTMPSLSSFGSDTDLEKDPGYTDKTDIDELALALPDHIFTYIWFDACYMGGIETVYQLRDKADIIVGMPTEDPGNGMPYHLTIPYLLRSNPDCESAAKEFFNFYETGADNSWDRATIGVYDMAFIEPVADFCRNAYFGAATPSSTGLQIYSRGKNGPFYDFGQYTLRMATTSASSNDERDFQVAMDKFVIYKAATKYDFAGREILPEYYSGLSCHLYDPEDNSEATNYYRSLDWYKRVYE